MKAKISKVISRIKEIENNKPTTDLDVRFDKDVAEILGISFQSLANYRAKGGLPSKHLIDYGLKNKISINELLKK